MSNHRLWLGTRLLIEAQLPPHRNLTEGRPQARPREQHPSVADGRQRRRPQQRRQLRTEARGKLHSSARARCQRQKRQQRSLEPRPARSRMRARWRQRMRQEARARCRLQVLSQRRRRSQRRLARLAQVPAARCLSVPRAAILSEEKSPRGRPDRKAPWPRRRACLVRRLVRSHARCATQTPTFQPAQACGLRARPQAIRPQLLHQARPKLRRRRPALPQRCARTSANLCAEEAGKDRVEGKPRADLGRATSHARRGQCDKRVRNLVRHLEQKVSRLRLLLGARECTQGRAAVRKQLMASMELRATMRAEAPTPAHMTGAHSAPNAQGGVLERK